MIRYSSFKWPIILGIVLLVLIVALLVLWIIGQATHQDWALLTIGAVFIALVLIGVVIYLVLTIKEIRLSRRQANFIDAVTHELKSPIASIKLYLQTLDMRDVGQKEQREFHRFMLEDIQRLDSLIDHLLVAARLDHNEPEEEPEDIPAEPILRRCIGVVARRFELSDEQIETDIHPFTIRGRSGDLEMAFTNLLDNAAKYADKDRRIHISTQPRSDNLVAVLISDNGQGVRFELRRKIFQRFFRGGSELERKTTGTGLGLHLVRSLVRRLKGKISVHGRGPLRGATFELELPGQFDQVEGTNPEPDKAQPAKIIATHQQTAPPS